MTISGAIVQLIFSCDNCGYEMLGKPEDTLLVDEELTHGDSNVQNAVLIENAPFDAAAHWVNRQCEKCGLTHMALVVLDEGARIVHKCKCGNQHES